MKKILLIFIAFYQAVVSPTLKNILGVRNFCRFSPTCSDYAKRQIVKEGVVKGGYLSLVRLLKCQPLS